MPRKIHSRAQWALLFAKANRGEIAGGKAKVEEMAQGVNYQNLPEHVAQAERKRRIRRKVIGRS